MNKIKRKEIMGMLNIKLSIIEFFVYLFIKLNVSFLGTIRLKQTS